MDFLLIGLAGSYLALIAYFIARLRRYYKIPINDRRSMTLAQTFLALYGFYTPPKKDIRSKAGSALTDFHKAWENMQDVFRQFEATFERRRQELQEAEGNLAKIEQEIKEQNERLRAQKELTPAAAREVERFVEKSGKSTLRQQVIVSAVFFLLGCAVTLTLTLLTK